ncbi:DUF3592 domain-containing protein [Kitasatospora sp. NPDC058965]|uniref:DUF3592 domain-containing protein n=1 Tax=Kitasatospora sp. NPDC058965 TaxID=3346682 RepID=UPI0036C40464
MAVGMALFLAFGGLVACLAGVAGLGEIRRLHRVGVSALALVRYRAPGREDGSAVSPPLLEFTTRGMQVVEVFSPVPSSRALPLEQGSRVRLRYDPADPGRVLLVGRERRHLEYAFVLLGAAAVLGAVVVIAVGA